MTAEVVFKLPDLGEGTVEAEILEWHAAVGDAITADAPLVDVMTDKANVEITAPVTGRIIALHGEPGENVAVGSALAVFDAADAAGPAADAASSDVTAAAPQPVETPAANEDAAEPEPADRASGRVMTSPAIRRAAAELGIDLGKVPGTGPDGRITRSDFEDWQRSAAPTAAAAQQPLIGLRRQIARHLARSVREIPHFSYVEEVDVTALESLRVALNAERPEAATTLSYLPFIALGLIHALRDCPQANAHFDSESEVLTTSAAVHLGIATQTDAGLVVPVIRDAGALDLWALAAEIQRVTAAARDGTAAAAELGGSTVTITSLGKLGGVASTPIINHPETAIIGVNRAVDRPVVDNGQVVVRRMMNLSSSFDHRVVDGYDAARLIQDVKRSLEQPALLFVPGRAAGR